MPATLIWLLSALTGGSAAAILLWALLWDRARGRRQCPRCFYDMSWTPDRPDAFPITCPECGRQIRKGRALRRTRRRWRLGGITAVIAILSLGAPLSLTGSWLRFVPAPALDFIIGVFFEDDAVAAYSDTLRFAYVPMDSTLEHEWHRYLVCWQLGRAAVREASTSGPQPGASPSGYSRFAALDRNSDHHSIRMAVPRLTDVACLPEYAAGRSRALIDLASIGTRARAARHRLKAALREETGQLAAADLLYALVKVTTGPGSRAWFLRLRTPRLPPDTRKMVVYLADRCQVDSLIDPWTIPDLDEAMLGLLAHEDSRLRAAAAEELKVNGLAQERVVPALEIALRLERNAAARNAMRSTLEAMQEAQPNLGRGPTPDP